MAQILKKSKTQERQRIQEEQNQKEIESLLKDFLLALALGDKKKQKELSDLVKSYVKPIDSEDN
ncbi:MAG: hypothetical protein QXT97_02475 [Candidatus Diapherotrites archaeon]